ncbi:MAG: hypothetical protein D4R97_06315 [Bacteroidetes bacterium]|nr:MAG: hypothetical protein D4R97_06315 [Bacteroidota bacterium]
MQKFGRFFINQLQLQPGSKQTHFTSRNSLNCTFKFNFKVKDILYNGPRLVLKMDGIKIRKRNLMISYPDITSITIKKARLARGWLGLILLGVILDIALVFLLYLFLVNFYDLPDVHGGHFHYSRRSSGIVIGILLVLPIFISFRIRRYFKRPVMLIIKWDRGEFRMKFSELNISVAELKRYLEGKVEIVTRDAKKPRSAGGICS